MTMTQINRPKFAYGRWGVFYNGVCLAVFDRWSDCDDWLSGIGLEGSVVRPTRAEVTVLNPAGKVAR